LIRVLGVFPRGVQMAFDCGVLIGEGDNIRNQVHHLLCGGGERRLCPEIITGGLLAGSVFVIE